MTGPSDLIPGLLALQMGLLPRALFLECAMTWLNELDVEAIVPQQPARGFETLLKEVLPPEVLEQVKAAAEALGARELPRVDSAVRAEILELKPRSEVREWLLKLPTAGAPAQTPAFEPKSRERRYVIGAEIARGGLGRVVEARDGNLGREVAIKLVLDGLDQELSRRFVREAQLAARLDHPHIVPVYDFDEMKAPGGGKGLFLCMKRIRGRNLGVLLAGITPEEARDAGRYSRGRLLKIFQDICLGIAFAHSKGVIHRDLKPANVMIGEYGETLIVDWGVAKERWTDDEVPAVDKGASLPGHPQTPELTMEGQVVGTPAYMAPEQAAGHLDEVDERSDVYALGGILYEILTRRPPFEGATQREVLDRVKAGRIESPSVRVSSLTARDASESMSLPRVPLEPVSPELDAICLKALAFRREERYPTAMALHDEIQLFLEGVKERERKQKEARERVEAGRRWFARYRGLRGEIEAQDKAVKEWGEKIKPHQSPEEKRPLWDAEARLRALREERIGAFSKASAEFGQALAVDSASVEASDGKCDLFFDRFLEAEGKRDREEVLLNRNMLATCDREGKYAARLDAPGKLTLAAFAYACDCLRPVRHPEWRVQIAETTTIPWRDGLPRPDVPLADKDRPVPAVATFPEGVRWGHRGDCVRREVSGVEVSIAKYEERDKRLVPGPGRVLGRTPLLDAVVPRGSWLCVLRHPDFAAVRLPVRIDRDGAWTQQVNLYRPDEIPSGFCQVPGGPFVFGGPWAGGVEAEMNTTEDFFVARFATTCAEYLEFLNDLSVQGHADEARKRQPREGDKKWWIEEGGRFRLPTAAEDPKMAWDPRWPVFSINWFDAVAYCAWKSNGDGRIYGLMHEEEYEKAARGVDGRVFSFGDEYDGSYSHTNNSIPEKISPMPVESFPADESPCGIRGLSGGVETWCSNAAEVPFRDWRCLRGGAWSYTSYDSRAGTRRGDQPTNVLSIIGLRLAIRPSRG
ncbi:MAG: hypothetical protein FD180_1381 [Planctomycetota bacterium]|nr:MAG: hypothetical protein FD180_1381 [Planctomycetota bacterium]